jgi:DNA-binding MarR family transcriptional regulator
MLSARCCKPRITLRRAKPAQRPPSLPSTKLSEADGNRKHYNEMDLSATENRVCFNLRWVTRAVTQFFGAEIRRHGIRPTQAPILGALRARSGLGLAELSDWLGMERTTLVRNLRPLQRDGLVRVTGGGRGGRVELAITDKGRKALARMFPAWRAAQDKAVWTLGPQRWSAILNDLEQAALKLNKQ